MEPNIYSGYRQTILVTNDDGICAPGLQALIRVLVATNRFNILVCAPDSIEGKSNINDFVLAAEACLPVLSAIFVALEDKTYPRSCFLNIDLPTDVLDHKGYKLNKQGKSIIEIGWSQVGSGAGGNALSTMTMEISSSKSANVDDATLSEERLLFKQEAKGPHVGELDTDYYYLQEGYITVTPLGALTHSELDCQTSKNGCLQLCQRFPLLQHRNIEFSLQITTQKIGYSCLAGFENLRVLSNVNTEKVVIGF